MHRIFSVRRYHEIDGRVTLHLGNIWVRLLQVTGELLLAQIVRRKKTHPRHSAVGGDRFTSPLHQHKTMIFALVGLR